MRRKKERIERAVRRLNGEHADDGGVHFQIGKSSAELDDAVVDRFKMRRALEAFCLTLMREYNALTDKDHECIAIRVYGVEFQREFGPKTGRKKR